MYRYILIGLLLISQVQTTQAGSPPVGTQFTYQGELIDGGSPANGVYDLNIFLYTSENGGSAIEAVAIDDIQINNGLINTEVDFGDLPFSGDERFLEVSIRAGDSTGGYTVLSPRTRINVTPYAIQSAFVENGTTPWNILAGGISYDDQVFVGNATPSGALMTVNSAIGEDPFRVRVSSGSKFTVFSNGGATIGTNSAAPSNGLLVQGQAQQSLFSHGFVKAGTVIGCGAGINGGSQRFFNNVNVTDFTTTQNGAAGGCTITVPFDISDAFFTVSAQETGGVNVFQTAVASCSAFSNTEIQCQLHLVQGSSTSLTNGVVQLMIY